MTKVAKITVSLSQEQVAEVRAAVARGEAPSVSGYVSVALEKALSAAGGPGSETSPPEDSLGELIDELTAEYGEPSAEAYDWADAALARSHPS